VLTQYVAPGLVVLALVVELTGLSFSSPALASAYSYLVAVVFSLPSIVMIGVCGWIVFLWDIDRLFFRLERKIDAQLPEETASGEEPDGSLLGRAREMLNNKTQHVRAQAVDAIEKAYWEDINAGGVLAFPQPDIAAAVEQIDKSRRDLLAPLTELVARALPLGNAPASIVSRVIFRYVAPDVKVRLYRRLVLRFLSQLGALFSLRFGAIWSPRLGIFRILAVRSFSCAHASGSTGFVHSVLVLRSPRLRPGFPPRSWADSSRAVPFRRALACRLRALPRGLRVLRWGQRLRASPRGRSE